MSRVKSLFVRSDEPKAIARVAQTDPSADRLALIHQVLFGEIVESSNGIKYLPLGREFGMIDSSDKIVVRSCYDHLTPLVLHAVAPAQQPAAVNKNLAVTGTPGIGKTVYGLLLLRKFIQTKETVLYWKDQFLCLFSFDEGVKAKFGLLPFAELSSDDNGGSTNLYAGFWDNRNGLIPIADVLYDDRVLVVHDPENGEVLMASYLPYIKRTIFILSYGHALFQLWTDKGNGPRNTLFLPTWTLNEGKSCSELLQFKNNLDADDLFQKFGGCIRAWLETTDMEKSFSDKVKEVVKNHGDNVLGRTLDTRGSIVHLFVDFDEAKPIFPAMPFIPASESQGQKQGYVFNQHGLEGAGYYLTPNSYNQFSNFEYRFGSVDILDKLNFELLQRGDDALKLFLSTWAGESGFESIYGGLFELRCHRVFTGAIPTTGKLLRARKVFSGTIQGDPQVIRFPPIQRVIRYPGNDPECLLSSTYSDKFQVGSYFWPRSSNHPTYDGAVLVSGSSVGIPEKAIVPLLLQMTVSGATGLPIRPKHIVRQFVRKKFDKVFSARIPGYQAGEAITTFVVPTECYGPFDFQLELNKTNDNSALGQPQYQWVLEIENVFLLTQETKKVLAEVQKTTKRKHKYTTRSVKRLALDKSTFETSTGTYPTCTDQFHLTNRTSTSLLRKPRNYHENIT